MTRLRSSRTSRRQRRPAPANPVLVRRIYAEARAHVSSRSTNPAMRRDVQDTLDSINKTQGFLRRVEAEFHRRLKRAGVYVEGA